MRLGKHINAPFTLQTVNLYAYMLLRTCLALTYIYLMEPRYVDAETEELKDITLITLCYSNISIKVNQFRVMWLR